MLSAQRESDYSCIRYIDCLSQYRVTDAKVPPCFFVHSQDPFHFYQIDEKYKRSAIKYRRWVCDQLHQIMTKLELSKSRTSFNMITL